MINAVDMDNYYYVRSLRWKKFRMLSSNQGVDRLPPTAGAWLQHILRAHLQANIWAQDKVLKPKFLDPCKLGWCKENDQLIPILSAVQAAPEAVVELLKCNCSVSKCSGRCTCKQNNLFCTELCLCEGDEGCYNINRRESAEDDYDE